MSTVTASSTAAAPRSGQRFRTIIEPDPGRLDRLPWSRFHWRVVIGLGTVWILDGLEVTIVGAIAARLTEAGSGIAHQRAPDIGIAARALRRRRVPRRAVLRPADRPLRPQEAVHGHARRSTSPRRSRRRSRSRRWYFFVCRFFTGMGIGGEYAAINSAIDELIPAREPRPRRPRDQRQLLGRRGDRRPRRAGAARHAHVRRRRRLAAGVRRRRGARSGHPARPPPRPGEPALAVHPRPRGGGRADRRRHRGGGARARPAQRARRARATRSRSASATRSRSARSRAWRSTRYPSRAVLGLALFVGQAFLYNAVDVRPRHDPARVLRRPLGRRCRTSSSCSRSATSSARCCSGACSTPSAASR